MLKGNKGEWGELYAFCYLLSSGVLQAADKNLQPIENVFFPIIRILRENMSYYPSDSGCDKVRIYKGDILCGEYAVQDFEDIVELLYQEIPKGQRSFIIPECEPFMDLIGIEKLKADSLHKQDIDIEIHDINTGIEANCGFSIKSYLGGDPTLVNAGKNTNFVYCIENCTDSIMHDFNSIETRNKLIERMQLLEDNKCSITFTGEMTSDQFKTNVRFIDTIMPEILAECLLNYYTSGKGTKDTHEIVNEVACQDPYDLESIEIYKYKMKQFLCACALGLTPEKTWEGGEDANGGYITVKRDGSVVCYHIYNRVEFLDYLYNYTYFDKGSSSRHNYMTIYKNDGNYYLRLNLQIRFREIG